MPRHGGPERGERQQTSGREKREDGGGKDAAELRHERGGGVFLGDERRRRGGSCFNKRGKARDYAMRRVFAVLERRNSGDARAGNGAAGAGSPSRAMRWRTFFKEAVRDHHEWCRKSVEK